MIWGAIALACVAVAVFPFWRETRRKPMDTDARASAPGQFVELSDGLTHYRWSGPDDGPVMVCIHGQTTPSVVWDGLIPGLTALGYRVLSYDHFGRGFSDRPRPRKPADQLLTQLRELLDSQGLRDNLTVIGFSMGGTVATLFTAAHPERVRRLVVIASGGIKLPPLSRAQRLAVSRGIGRWIYLAFYPMLFRRGTEAARDLPGSVPDIVDRQQEQLAYRGFILAVRAFDRWFRHNSLEASHRAIAKTDIPVMALFGEADEVVPLAAVGPLVSWNKAVRVEQIKGAGHGLPYTHTDQVLDHIKSFLDETSQCP